MKNVLWILAGVLISGGGLAQLWSWNQASKAFSRLATAPNVGVQAFQQDPRVVRAFKAAGIDPGVRETSAGDAADMAERITRVIFRRQVLGGVGALIGVGVAVFGLLRLRRKTPPALPG